MQLVTPTHPGPGPASSLAAHFLLYPPTSLTCPSAPFCLFWGYPSCHFFYSLSHMLSSRHTCLTFLLYSVAVKAMLEVSKFQTPRHVNHFLLFRPISIYPLISPLTMAQVMFASKYVKKLVLHIINPGFL